MRSDCSSRHRRYAFCCTFRPGSSRFPSPIFMRRVALWCPDFPQPPLARKLRPSGERHTQHAPAPPQIQGKDAGIRFPSPRNSNTTRRTSTSNPRSPASIFWISTGPVRSISRPRPRSPNCAANWQSSDFLIPAFNYRGIGNEFRNMTWHSPGPTARQYTSPWQRHG